MLRKMILALPLLLVGCVHNVTAPLPAGAVNGVDAQINAILQAGHAAVVQYNTDVSSGFVPSVAYKAIMTNLTTALNVADPLYQGYHVTLMTAPQTAEPQSLVMATANVQSALNQVPTAVVPQK